MFLPKKKAAPETMATRAMPPMIPPTIAAVFELEDGVSVGPTEIVGNGVVGFSVELPLDGSRQHSRSCGPPHLSLL